MTFYLSIFFRGGGARGRGKNTNVVVDFTQKIFNCEYFIKKNRTYFSRKFAFKIRNV